MEIVDGRKVKVILPAVFACFQDESGLARGTSSQVPFRSVLEYSLGGNAMGLHLKKFLPSRSVQTFARYNIGFKLTILRPQMEGYCTLEKLGPRVSGQNRLADTVPSRPMGKAPRKAMQTTSLTSLINSTRLGRIRPRLPDGCLNLSRVVGVVNSVRSQGN